MRYLSLLAGRQVDCQPNETAINISQLETRLDVLQTSVYRPSETRTRLQLELDHPAELTEAGTMLVK